MGETIQPTTNAFDTADFDDDFPIGADFFRHVNATWLTANPIPPEYGSWGSFHEVHVRNEELLRELLDAASASESAAGSPEQMAGDFWASGLDEDAIEAAGITPLQPYLDLIASLQGAPDLVRVAAGLRSSGLGAIFSTSVSPDYEDSERYLLYVGQGGMGLPERGYYFRDDEHSVALREAYVEHISRVLSLLGVESDPAAEADGIVELETRLAEFSFSPVELRDTDLTTNKYQLGDFAAALPGFDLTTFLGTVVGAPPDSVNLDNPEFFKNVGGVLADVAPGTLRSYLRWNLIRATANALTTPFVEASFDFYGRRLGGQRELKPRWKRVLAAATADIGQQVSKLYVSRAFSASAKDRCEAMVDRLFESMREAIERLDWMGPDTKAKALAKLTGFTYKIGYPDEWRDYSALSIDRSTYVTNRLRAGAFEFSRKINKLGEPVDRGDWAMAPHEVNAYYHPLHNEIVFPAGILQPPFFYDDADEATNLGAIGSVIGHEITHGFDDQGSKFDAAGNLRNWWTEEDRTAFDERAAGLIDQYNGYEPLEGLAVNGELTLGENIADLGGVTVAFAALRNVLAAAGDAGSASGSDGLTPEQRFFVSYATIWRGNYTDEYTRLIVSSDPHAPNEFRCNGVLENFPPFAAAFGLEADELSRASGEHIKIW